MEPHVSFTKIARATLENIFACKDVAASSSPDQPQQPHQASVFPWKVLVIDLKAQDIISPLFATQELAKLNIAITFRINEPRDPLAVAPAIYIIEPTDENIVRLCQDIQTCLYASFYLHFINSIPHRLLKQIADACRASNTAHLVKRVCDNFCNFICLEKDLFVLRTRCAPELKYSSIQRSLQPKVGLNKLHQQQHPPTGTLPDPLASIVNSLLSVMGTLGIVPYIVGMNTQLAQEIAMQLNRKLINFLEDPQHSGFFSSFNGAFKDERVVVFISDRSLDLATILHHPWTYQALCHDILSLNNNTVTIAHQQQQPTKSTSPSQHNKPQSANSPQKLYLDTDRDSFWAKTRHANYPTTASEIQKELARYNEDRKKIPQPGDFESQRAADAAGQPGSNINNAATNLIAAIESLPDLNNRKDYIDKHMKIIWEIAGEIDKRALDVYYETEENLLKKSPPNIIAIPGIASSSAAANNNTGPLGISGPAASTLFSKNVCESTIKIIMEEKGRLLDKLRLYIILILTHEVRDEDQKRVYEFFQHKEINVSCLSYITNLKKQNKISPARFEQTSAEETVSPLPDRSSPNPGQLFLQGQQLLTSFSSTIMQTGADLLKRSPLSLRSSSLKLPITRITESLLDNSYIPEWDTMVWYDPAQRIAEPVQKPRVGFNTAIVFVAGGGNYVEYLNLTENIAKDPAKKRRAYYATTEMINAEEFIHELNLLSSSP